ncbi:AAA family ATPase [Microvirga sp. W0021]|uniref:AAA family ATPase n=1 Tax=Hohaiivirga grylli TaxID=3133970 RepID=A0ABV0BLM1_9HYPH
MLSINSNNLFILTGGPGSGKTTLINALENRGFQISEETGRRIIKEQVANNGTALPWEDKAAFAGQMLKYEIENYKLFASSQSPVFFDRGILDVIGYAELEGLSVSQDMQSAAQNHRYNQLVFILPPWQEIYENDAERKQNFEIAEATYKAMLSVYTRYGYRLLEIPRRPIEERVRFILEHIQNTSQHCP